MVFDCICARIDHSFETTSYADVNFFSHMASERPRIKEQKKIINNLNVFINRR